MISEFMAALVALEPGVSLVSGGTSVLEGRPSSSYVREWNPNHIIERE